MDHTAARAGQSQGRLATRPTRQFTVSDSTQIHNIHGLDIQESDTPPQILERFPS